MGVGRSPADTRAGGRGGTHPGSAASQAPAAAFRGRAGRGRAGRGRAGRFSALAAALLLLPGCSGNTSGGDAGTQAAGAGKDWSVGAQGIPTPSPNPPTPTPSQSTVQPLPTLVLPSPAETTTWLYPAPCAGRLYPGKMDMLVATPGAGTATVTWRNSGDDTVQEYKVAAVPQDLVSGPQPPLVWHSVPPGTGCSDVTTTLGGLRTGGRYALWLVAVVLDSGAGALSSGAVWREVMIGRSRGFVAL